MLFIWFSCSYLCCCWRHIFIDHLIALSSLLLSSWPLSLLPFSFRLNLHWPLAAKHALNRGRVKDREGGREREQSRTWAGFTFGLACQLIDAAAVEGDSYRTLCICKLAELLPKGGLESSLLCPSHRIAPHRISFHYCQQGAPLDVGKTFSIN